MSVRHFLFAIALLLPPLLAHSKDDASADASATVVHYTFIKGTHSPPWGWFDERRQMPDGFVNYLFNNLSRRLGMRFEVSQFDTNRPDLIDDYLRAVERRELDIFLFPPSVDDPALYRLREPVIVIETGIFLRAIRKPALSQWAELKPLTGGAFFNSDQAIIGGSPEFHAFAEQHLKIVRCESNDACVESLIKGDIDFLVGVVQSTKALLRVMAPDMSYQTFDQPLMRLPIYWYMARNSPLFAHATQIEEILAETKSNGYQQLLLNRAMNSYIRYRADLRASALPDGGDGKQANSQ